MPKTRREFLMSAGSPGRGASDGAGCLSTSPAPPPDLATHAAERLTFGPRTGEVAAIRQMGFDAFLYQQLNPSTINDTAVETGLNAHPNNTLSETWAQLYDRRSSGDYNNSVILPLRQVRNHTWVRQIYSKRQLYEKVVAFWHNHFNVHGFDFLIRSLWPKWDNIIRQHAFGNFRAFLEATATHPVMLNYLDNFINTNAGTNENYARELFELHTLGAENYRVPGGYVDDDVYEASRCFTGWSYEQGSTAADRGQFKYIESAHDRFQKIVLGTQIPRDQPPLADGRTVLDLLAFHPGTARHIARKLCVRFIGDNPPESIVESTAQAFITHKDHPYQLTLVLGHLLSSQEFRDPAIRLNKLKTPHEWTVSVFRALNMTWPNPVTDTSSGIKYPNEIHNGIYDQMGQPVFGWRPPDGAPDTLFEWATSNGLMRRWTYVMSISSGSYYPDRGLDIPFANVMPSALNKPKEIVDWAIGKFIQREVSEATYTALAEFLAEGRSWHQPIPFTQVVDKLKQLFTLIVLTPEFMRR